MKRRLTYNQFIDWAAYLEVKEESRTKQDHYAVAIRHDLHRLISVFCKGFGNTTVPVPDVDDLFLTGASADKFVPPEGYEFDPDDPVKGDFNQGYGLPGIEIGQPLDDKWQKVNNEEKRKWEAFAKIGGGQLVHALPPGKVKSDG